MALDAANRKVAELSAVLETGGDRLTAGVRESKIVEVSKKNRNLNLALEREKAEKQRALAQLKAANARLDENGKDRTESQVEAACREVVEEASKNAETAQKECAEWREKWKAATARAERFSGQKAYIKTENDRLKRIIRREIGDEVDLGNLDEANSATGGWKGRARQIRDLKMRCDVLKAQLADANDALKVLAAEPGSELDPVAAARRELDEARDALDRARDETAKAREKAKAGATRRRELEAETADLREKLAALKEKSDHDNRFVATLKSELDRANQRASVGAATGDFSGKSVPAAVFKSMEARAVAQEEKLREQDREMRTLRAAIASGDVLADTTSAAAIAAAAAGGESSADDDDAPGRRRANTRRTSRISSATPRRSSGCASSSAGNWWWRRNRWTSFGTRCRWSAGSTRVCWLVWNPRGERRRIAPKPPPRTTPRWRRFARGKSLRFLRFERRWTSRRRRRRG